jgi:nitrite reductase/ring-hydroxylating ferredoxin subunit
MTAKKIGTQKDFAYVPMKEIEADGNEILVIKTGKIFTAIGNQCSHMGCKLSGGKLDGTSVRCPCHGSEFNVITGEVVKGPAKKPEPVFAVREERDDLFLDL